VKKGERGREYRGGRQGGIQRGTQGGIQRGETRRDKEEGDKKEYRGRRHAGRDTEGEKRTDTKVRNKEGYSWEETRSNKERGD
jgi:hypothetical protein